MTGTMSLSSYASSGAVKQDAPKQATINRSARQDGRTALQLLDSLSGGTPRDKFGSATNVDVEALLMAKARGRNRPGMPVNAVAGDGHATFFDLKGPDGKDPQKLFGLDGLLDDKATPAAQKSFLDDLLSRRDAAPGAFGAMFQHLAVSQSIQANRDLFTPQGFSVTTISASTSISTRVAATDGTVEASVSMLVSISAEISLPLGTGQSDDEWLLTHADFLPNLKAGSTSQDVQKLLEKYREELKAVRADPRYAKASYEENRQHVAFYNLIAHNRDAFKPSGFVIHTVDAGGRMGTLIESRDGTNDADATDWYAGRDQNWERAAQSIIDKRATSGDEMTKKHLTEWLQNWLKTVGASDDQIRRLMSLPPTGGQEQTAATAQPVSATKTQAAPEPAAEETPKPAADAAPKQVVDVQA